MMFREDLQREKLKARDRRMSNIETDAARCIKEIDETMGNSTRNLRHRATVADLQSRRFELFR